MAELVDAGYARGWMVFRASIFQSVSEWLGIVKTEIPIICVPIVVFQNLLHSSLGMKSPSFLECIIAKYTAEIAHEPIHAEHHAECRDTTVTPP